MACRAHPLTDPHRELQVPRDLAGLWALMTSLPDGQALYERITAQSANPHPFTAFFETADVDVIARTLFPHEARPLNWLANRTRLHAPFQW